MKIQSIGCGEAFHFGKGNSSFFLKEKGLLFDCGYQIPERIWQKKIADQIEAIYITHTHADHVFGLVPLLTKYVVDGRQQKLTIIGRKGIESYLIKIIEAGYKGVWKRKTYPIEFIEINSREKLLWNGMEMSFARTVHAAINYSVKILLSTGKSFAISGDGAMSSASKELFKGVDLLIHEVYTLKDKPGHTDFEMISEYMKKSEIKKLVVTHVSSDESSKVKLKAISKGWIVADDQISLTI